MNVMNHYYCGPLTVSTEYMNPRITNQQQDKMSAPKKVGRWHLIFGFLSILFLMVAVTTYTLLRISRINDELSAVVNVHNVKGELVSKLRDAMRKRQISLRDLLLADNPFSREDARDRHTLSASQFMSTRLDLLEMPMSAQEKIAFEKMTTGARDGAVVQRKVIAELEDGASQDEVSAMFEKALKAQDAAFAAMNELAVIQRNAANAVAENAQQEFDSTIKRTVFLVVGGLILGAIVAWSALGRDKRMKVALNAYQNQLEELVQKRTTDLVSANSELESYSYSLAHDLNAPLRAVTSYSQILAEDASDKLNESEIDSLQRITRAGQVMNRLIEDILKLSRITRSGFHTEAVSLSELAKSQATRLSSLNLERKFHWDIAEDILVKGDALQLNLLLEHLLENAVKFTKNNEISIIQFGLDAQFENPVYFVRDNGCGFDMRYADRLFMAFQRLHSDDQSTGTGVGLAMVQRIAQRHAGSVWAESEVGVGSTFYFSLSGGA